jgi:hypothetical protein
VLSGEGGGNGDEASGNGGAGGRETTGDARSGSATAAGIRTTTSLGTSLITVRTSRDSSNLVANAMPATNSCDNPMSANAQQEMQKTGNGFDFSDPIHRNMRSWPRLVNPTGLRRLDQSCQFKHKEVIIGKLEPRMDANEREFSMSYKNL